MAGRPEQKFGSDMVHGLLAAESCLLTDIVDTLHGSAKKVNAVERLTRHLNKGVPEQIQRNYFAQVKTMVGENPVIHIDDSDVVKPCGKHFEALGTVRDGSKSSQTKNVYGKGYIVTEACILSKNRHPVSIFSEIHSSEEKKFTSINHVTFRAMERGAELFGKATFVMDRGYDDNKMFLKLDELKQDYVIRIRKNRKIKVKDKWFYAGTLCATRKGKLKMSVKYRGKTCDAYLSHVKGEITASGKKINLVLVYGLGETPMMLVTNRQLHSKDDVLETARLYFSRWKIEEYFRCKKQRFSLENFRVRNLKSINALNFFITVAMAFLVHISMKKPHNALKIAIIQQADPIKKHIYFHLYRISKGIAGLLQRNTTGINAYFKPTTKPQLCGQLSFKLAA